MRGWLVGLAGCTFPCAVKQLLNHAGGDGVAKGRGMHAAVLFPRQRAGRDLLGHFLREVDSGHRVMTRDGLVRLNGQRGSAGLKRLEHPLVHEVGDHDVHVRIALARVPDDAFESAHALRAGVVGVLIVIHRELNEEQVHRAAGQHILFEAKGSGG